MGASKPERCFEVHGTAGGTVVAVILGVQETRVIESRSRRPVAAPAVTFALFLALLLVVSAPIAFYDVFSTFMAHDDEGFFLRIVKHFPDGFSLSLYDEIRVSSGPFLICFLSV